MFFFVCDKSILFAVKRSVNFVFFFNHDYFFFLFFFCMYLCSSFDIITQFSNSRWFSLWHSVIIQSLIVNPCFSFAEQLKRQIRDQRETVANSLASISVLHVESKANLQSVMCLWFSNLFTTLSCDFRESIRLQTDTEVCYSMTKREGNFVFGYLVMQMIQWLQL